MSVSKKELKDILVKYAERAAKVNEKNGRAKDGRCYFCGEDVSDYKLVYWAISTPIDDEQTREVYEHGGGCCSETRRVWLFCRDCHLKLSEYVDNKYYNNKEIE